MLKPKRFISLIAIGESKKIGTDREEFNLMLYGSRKIKAIRRESTLVCNESSVDFQRIKKNQTPPNPKLRRIFIIDIPKGQLRSKEKVCVSVRLFKPNSPKDIPWSRLLLFGKATIPVTYSL
jgi:hypothetical protein